MTETETIASGAKHIHLSRLALGQGSEALLEALNSSPCVICAPMVRGSELAFRMLARRHGVQICYTPMIKADKLLAGGADELSLLESCCKDRPLVAQFAGRDPSILGQAVRLVLDRIRVDAVDLNLGCPQPCAQEGGYGAFLQEEPQTAAACVREMCVVAAPVPVFCKIRILDSVEDSIAYARLLESAGCSLLAVHCRHRSAKHDGEPDLDHLRQIIAALNIPVVANGGIGSLRQASYVMEHSGSVAVMVASALLRCPRAFSSVNAQTSVCSGLHNPADMALEYLDFASRFPPPSPLYIRKHLRWIFRNELQSSYKAARAGWFEGKNVDEADWRSRAWTFLEQPYLVDLQQFRDLVRLIAHRRGWPTPTIVGGTAVPSFREIRIGKTIDSESDDEIVGPWLFET